jgi:hypothetical protein
MNPAEAGRILAVAIGFDSRMPQPDPRGFLRGIWADALADVPYEDAYRVVIGYYTSERYLDRREPISPADIVVGARKLRSVGNAPDVKSLPVGAGSSEEVRASAMAAAREVFARLPQLANAGQMPASLRRLTRKARNTQRRAEAASRALAELDQLVRETSPNPDTTTEGA